MRTIVIGVTGSIAAYKACELVRQFVKNGDSVHVVMTAHAAEFVTPLTFRTLSRNPVPSALFGASDEWQPGHISLAELADVMVVAPATANIIAKMAHGIADRGGAGDEHGHVRESRNAGQHGASQRARRGVRGAGRGRACVRHERSGAHGRAQEHIRFRITAVAPFYT